MYTRKCRGPQYKQNLKYPWMLERDIRYYQGCVWGAKQEQKGKYFVIIYLHSPCTPRQRVSPDWDCNVNSSHRIILAQLQARCTAGCSELSLGGEQGQSLSLHERMPLLLVMWQNTVMAHLYKYYKWGADLHVYNLFLIPQRPVDITMWGDIPKGD